MNNKTFESKCNGEVIRGSIEQIIAKYEAKAYAAQRSGDTQNEHVYFQHAEYWKRKEKNRYE